MSASRSSWVVLCLLAAGCADPQGRPSEPTPQALRNEVGTPLLGMHGPWDALETQTELLPGGWLVDILYSTDELWSADSRWNAAAQAGHRVVLRVDYARGTNVPPPGGEGTSCIEGFDGHVGSGSSPRSCYLQALETIVGNNSGVHDWIIGNEPNLHIEAEGFAGRVIEPAHFAEIYSEARAVVRSLPGHADDVVMLGGVSPGPVVSGQRYADGVDYLLEALGHLDPLATEGLALHAYGGWPVPEDNGGQRAIDVFDEAWRSQVRAIDDAGFRCSELLLSEFNASYHHDVVSEPDAQHPDAAAGAQFIRDAVDGVSSWNAAGGHPIAGMVWFTWTGGQWPQYRMDVWWDRSGDGADDNWATTLSAVGAQHNGAAPSDACTETQLDCPCEPGTDNVCTYVSESPGCRARLGLDSCETGADWVAGWHLYNDAGDPGFVCGAASQAPTCSCAQGRYHDGTPIPASLTYCGFSVCGMDDSVYTCGADNAWVRTGDTCGEGACRCAGGRHQDGTLVDPNHTECGVRVCGMSDSWWTCEPSGWVESVGSSCAID